MVKNVSHQTNCVTCPPKIAQNVCLVLLGKKPGALHSCPHHPLAIFIFSLPQFFSHDAIPLNQTRRQRLPTKRNTARRAIDNARSQLLKLLGVSPPAHPLSSIWFTGCGTESDNLAVQLAIQSSSHIAKKHIVTCNVEHPAIEGYLKSMLDLGVIDDVTFVSVNDDGRVSAADVIDAIQPSRTILVTLMLANNESGAL